MPACRLYYIIHRKIIFPDTNTWGAYQCYGDPFYKLRLRTPQKKEATLTYIISEEAEIDLYNLLNNAEVSGQSTEKIAARLIAISKAVNKSGVRNAVITEKEALILCELCNYDSAVLKFEQLLKMEKASFSFSSMEKYCDIRGIKYVQNFTETKQKQSGFITKMNILIRDVKALLNAGETAERLNLMGTSYKRKALFTANKADKFHAYKEAAFYFYKAYTIGGDNKLYSYTNLLQLESILILNGKRSWEKLTNKIYSYTLPAFDEVTIELAKKLSLFKKPVEEMSSADIITMINIKICLLFIDNKFTKNVNTWNALSGDFKKLYLNKLILFPRRIQLWSIYYF